MRKNHCMTSWSAEWTLESQRLLGSLEMRGFCVLFDHLGSGHQLNMADVTAGQGYSLGRFQSFLALFHG
ncbi:hypothetical protein LEMLEM_LOCUS15210 [Lemmus lemmus]